jgi:hypothetical protein
MAQARKAFVCVTVASLFILALSGCVKHDQGNAEDAGGTKNSIPIGWEQRQATAALRQMGASLYRESSLPQRPVTAVVVYRHAFDNTGMECLRALPNLVKVDVATTSVTDAGLDSLEVLHDLRELSLRQTRVTDAGVVHLKSLGELRRCDLRGTRVGDAGLENLKDLKQLEVLDLGETQVTDVGLKSLEGLTNLKTLILTEARVTPTGIAAIKSKLPKTDILYTKTAGR